MDTKRNLPMSNASFCTFMFELQQKHDIKKHENIKS